MEKIVSVLHAFVLIATSFGISPAHAQTLNVGLTIVPADRAAVADAVRRPANKRNGHVRIVEYVSPGYAAIPKSRQKASAFTLK
ncbi:hypothetical protein [Phyllobacterium zundukense]|jgi:hypothetical protein|uniref:Uncharacterized protein n=1 Tax=Phyllobacterium zundukense TaxID=1867719 RepID=A0ACD4D4C3_9HYPH|nr:hypothetical protein [Phyllobacterium zundukense]UXN60543.1 hypothetical protein N8E88_29310 [Phyllobacterium zundukense]